jgi:hypothetical protein
MMERIARPLSERSLIVTGTASVATRRSARQPQNIPHAFPFGDILAPGVLN